ncbi:MAG: hypothetical protein IH840_02720 [Candidatus Heimdallarchaeota archaeon]|nr:hypothetical protein [Candidatus Heimdallarchaeota archaeon]
MSRSYTKQTLRDLALFSKGFCYFDDCRDELMSEGEFVGNVAHIHSVKQKGPRHDSTKTTKELNQIWNLLLLCYRHHIIVDSKRKETEWPAEKLFEVKRTRENDTSERRISQLDQMIELLMAKKDQETAEIRDQISQIVSNRISDILDEKTSIRIDSRLGFLTIHIVPESILEENFVFDSHKVNEVPPGLMRPIYAGSWDDSPFGDGYAHFDGKDQIDVNTSGSYCLFHETGFVEFADHQLIGGFGPIDHLLVQNDKKSITKEIIVKICQSIESGIKVCQVLDLVTPFHIFIQIQNIRGFTVENSNRWDTRSNRPISEVSFDEYLYFDLDDFDYDVICSKTRPFFDRIWRASGSMEVPTA